MTVDIELPSGTEVGSLTQVRTWSRYPGYQSVSIPGVEDVPAHWRVKRLRFVASIDPRRRAGDRLASDAEVSFLPMEAIGERGELDLGTTRSVGEVESGYTLFKDGDVLIAKITPCFENGKGAMARGLVGGLGYGTTELYVVRPAAELDSRFLYLLTTTHNFRAAGAAQMYGAGGQKRVPDSFVRDYHVALPPRDEQDRIVAFLGHETAKVDALVSKKRRLLSLIEEKRVAIISHAVIGGLDRTAPMNDSGVEWLGPVPARWQVKRLRDVVGSLQTGPFGSQLHEHDYIQGGIPVINPSHLIEGRIVPTPASAVDEATASRLSIHRLEEGDIVLARRGEMGRCGLVRDRELGWLCGTGSLRVRPKRAIVEPEFLLHALSIPRTRDWLQLESVGSTMSNLNTGIIGRIPLAIPPLAEQRTILKVMEGETARLDTVAQRVRTHVDLLEEYRSALLSAAVTGKIDVREA